MTNDELELVERLHREQIERAPKQPLAPPLRQQTIPYTELPEDISDSPSARNWNCYRREVGRLLAEGQEGKWVLIQDQDIIGIWDTEEEPNQVRLQRFLMQDVLIQQVRTREPALRGPTYFRLCRS